MSRTIDLKREDCRKTASSFSIEEFKNPSAIHRGMPFWAWNTKLREEDLEWEIGQFKQMGMGGFYIHTRVGLDTPYLGEKFMECVKKSAKAAGETGLLCGLYDEDRWPSGYAGGMVTQNREYRCRALLVTPYRQGTRQYKKPEYDSRAAFSPQGNGRFLAAYQVRLDEDGRLHDYRRCGEDEPERDGYRLWYVYLETAYDSPWFNGQAYVDALNEKAVACFLETTHERYYAALGHEFGGTVPSIFTDEPQLTPKGTLGRAKGLEEVMLPYTGDFGETFAREYGGDILNHIPELLWELKGKRVSQYRYWYHDHIAQRFSQAYGKQIGKWCEAHNISLCGHMMEEPTLQSQTKALGEVMRSLSGFTLPGIDMLCDAREYTTAKQAQSVCRQYGREGVVSELYGVTNWDFDFRRHKLQGDWQAALGVTNRVHHLNWMSMAGEAKRDYPAAIGFQSPWYKEYPMVEDHFARVNVAMKSGKPAVRIGVIHPVESFWLYFGPNDQTGGIREELESRFKQITEWLLFGTLDFDYISEGLIHELWDGRQMGVMDYDIILIPGCVTLRKTTLDMLKDFLNLGKQVLFLGEVPGLVDAKESSDAIHLAERCLHTEFTEHALMEALEEYRFLDIRYSGEKHLKKPNHKKNWNGERAKKYLCQIRQDEEGVWVFVANGKALENQDLVLPDDLEIRFKGLWRAVKYDTLTGTEHETGVRCEAGSTFLNVRMYEEDSLLLRLVPTGRGPSGDYLKTTGPESIPTEADSKMSGVLWERNLFSYKKAPYEEKMDIIAEEPNVLLLDMAEYMFDKEQESAGGPEEILRIDNLFRRKLGYPLRRAALAQPWTVEEKEQEKHILCLKYIIQCADDLKGISLALEEERNTEIFLDQQMIDRRATGYYVDPCITRVSMPDLSAGTHELLLKVRFDRKTNVEPCYLLGDFDVELLGAEACLHKKRSRYSWQGAEVQGMPFYGGNLIYRTELQLDAGHYEIEATKFRAPLILVKVDGRTAGRIAYSPYRVTFDITEKKTHVIELHAFGNRVNTFGAVHNCDEREVYFDPNAWRTLGDGWSYEYQLKKTGILKAPVIRKLAEKY